MAEPTRTPESWRRLLRLQYLRVVHRSHDPHLGALSFALGIFLGLLPLSMLATLLALFLPRRLGLRVVPAVVGTFAGNWLTAPFILGSAVVVGRLLTTGRFAGFQELLPPADQDLAGKVGFFLHLGWSFFLGILLVSFLGALVGYLAALQLSKAAWRLRKARMLERLRQRLPHPHLPIRRPREETPPGE